METIGFRADVKKVMDIIIRSLYQNSEVFLRELISNSSDALNKARIQALTSDKIFQKDAPLVIEIIPDKKNDTLTIKDTGVGMTKTDLSKNLGTIARSGTLEFLDTLEESNDVESLIGQFGVGFYSAFLVAKEVVVRTRGSSTNSKAYEWRSTGKDGFSIQEIKKEDRGTEVILHLKADEIGYLDRYKIQDLVKKYSDFVSFPISWIAEEEDSEDSVVEATSKEGATETSGDAEVDSVSDVEDKEDSVEDKEDSVEDKEDSVEDKEDSVEDKEDSVEEEEEKDYRGELLNSRIALWRKPGSEITDEKYAEFYKHVSGKWDDPFLRIHYKAENPEFYFMLFIPKTKPVNYLPETTWGIKLYTRKVLIQESNQSLIPEYFRFIVGVVDSEDLPLNVSREVVQNSRLTRQMKKFMHKKIIDDLEKFAEENTEGYLQFFREFGQYLKEGVAAGDKQKERLVSLLRFYSTIDGADGKTGAVSLDDYITRMQTEQEKILYLAGTSYEVLIKSPHLEYYSKKEQEILLLVDPIDNFLTMHLQAYDGKSFYLIDEDESEPEKKEEDNKKEKEDKEPKKKEGPHAELLTRFEEVLKGKVKEVKVSDRLIASPARLVTPKGGMASTYEKVMKYMDNSASGMFQNFGGKSKILQINPEHEIIKGIQEKLSNKDLADMLINQIYANTILKEGETPDTNTFIENIEKIMKSSLK